MAKAMRVTGTVLLVLGFTLLEFVAYELWGTNLRANASQQALERDIGSTFAGVTVQPVLEEPPPVTVLPPERPGKPRAWARLRIPKIGVNRFVVEGARRGDLIYGPGHYAGTPLPGTAGSVGIAGHRTTWGAPFHNIDRLRPGDAISLQTAAGLYRYRVTDATVVSPRRADVLNGDPGSTAVHTLTLTTCTPKYSAAKRLIVWADLATWERAA